MMAYFKYCKIKEFSNLVCVSCHRIFHPSCLEMKNHKSIEGYKVYCSNKCDELDKNDKPLKDLEKKKTKQRFMKNWNWNKKKKLWKNCSQNPFKK